MNDPKDRNGLESGQARDASLHLVTFSRGEYVFREGDLGTEMYVIRDGRVEVVHSVDGHPQQLAVLEKGDFFGDMAVLEDRPRNASIRSLEQVTLVRVDRSTFVGMLTENPEITVRIMRKLSRRLRAADGKIKELQGGSAEGPATEAFRPGVEVSGKASPRRQKRDTEGAKAPVTGETPMGPCKLRHEASGAGFLLADDRASTIGRRDPVTGVRPDLDMTPIDKERTISRQHARIYPHGEKFFIVEDIGATNGTFVNGRRIRPGIPVELKSKDTVRFGIVECHFYLDRDS